MSESVTEISRKITAGSGSEDEIIIQSTDGLEIGRKRETWGKEGDGLSRIGRVKLLFPGARKLMRKSFS
jgi:hypothetical protein